MPSSEETPTISPSKRLVYGGRDRAYLLFQVALPSGCCGRAALCSGLAAKHFIDVGAGVIDEGYGGNVGVVLFNCGTEKLEVKKGNQIAQLICECIFYPEIEEVQVLDVTERGSGGFSSTEKN